MNNFRVNFIDGIPLEYCPRKENKTMKKIKKNESKTQTRAVYLEDSITLAEVLQRVLADGVTDLSTVKYDHNYQGCGGHPEGEYCYCPPSYSDMRFVYEVKT